MKKKTEKINELSSQTDIWESCSFVLCKIFAAHFILSALCRCVCNVMFYVLSERKMCSSSCMQFFIFYFAVIYWNFIVFMTVGWLWSGLALALALRAHLRASAFHLLMYWLNQNFFLTLPANRMAILQLIKG